MERCSFSAKHALIAAAFTLGSLPAFAKDESAPLSDADRTHLGLAETACKSRDFPSLLEAMANSDAVVQRYSAPKIDVTTNGAVKQVDRADYRRFPISIIDYMWVTRASAAAALKNSNAKLKYLSIDQKNIQNNGWRVDFFPTDEAGGEPIRNAKPSGSLLFEPTDTCWQLTLETDRPPR